MQIDCGLGPTCRLCAAQDVGVSCGHVLLSLLATYGNLDVKSESRGHKPLCNQTPPACALKKGLLKKHIVRGAYSYKLFMCIRPNSYLRFSIW
ncbi:UNVERIFIED_CONTAM: hypothetical protein K2H54_040839 [Gekko kuhli]